MYKLIGRVPDDVLNSMAGKHALEWDRGVNRTLFRTSEVAGPHRRQDFKTIPTGKAKGILWQYQPHHRQVPLHRLVSSENGHHPLLYRGEAFVIAGEASFEEGQFPRISTNHVDPWTIALSTEKHGIAHLLQGVDSIILHKIDRNTLKCYMYYPRLINEKGKKQLYGPGHTSKKIAQQYEQKLKNEIAERKMFPERFPDKKKFDEFVPEYLKKHATSLKSYDFYEVICTILKRHFGDTYLYEISRYHVESYQAERSKQVGVCMVNRELTILKGIFTKAIDWGFPMKNPVKGVKLGKEKPRERFLAPEEIGKLIEACRKERQAPYLNSVVIIALFTGMRKKELLTLKREHISMDRDIMKIVGSKSGDTRFARLYPTAKREVAKLLIKSNSEYLIHDKDGEPFKDIKKSFNAAVRRAELQDVRFHDLRRTFGTIGAIDAGIDEKAMQNLLGHASIETTMKHYVMSTEETRKRSNQEVGWFTGHLYGHFKKRGRHEDGLSI